jgi:diacylglycerol kinase family enzyme
LIFAGKYKIAFLVSAKSGTGKGSEIQPLLPGYLEELGLSAADYRIQPISTHDIVLQAADLAKKAERLIVVGGDGTAAAALAGVRASGNTIPVGVIPVGTGNDLARVTGIKRVLHKKGLKQCVQACLSADPVPIDIWRVNDAYFMVNYLSLGMDAAVVQAFNRHREERGTPYRSSFINRCIYGYYGLRHLFAGIAGTTVVNVSNNGNRESRHFAGLRELVVSNIPSYAAGALPAPDADYADRLLNITTFANIATFVGLFLVQPVRPLRVCYGNMLAQHRGDAVELRVAAGNAIQIDGEDRTYLLDNTDTLTIEHAGRGLVIRTEL